MLIVSIWMLLPFWFNCYKLNQMLDQRYMPKSKENNCHQQQKEDERNARQTQLRKIYFHSTWGAHCTPNKCIYNTFDLNMCYVPAVLGTIPTFTYPFFFLHGIFGLGALQSNRRSFPSRIELRTPKIPLISDSLWIAKTNKFTDLHNTVIRVTVKYGSFTAKT